MPVTERMPMTIEALIKFILGVETIPINRRKEIASALKRLVEIVGVDQHSMIADPGVFRRLFASGKWHQAGISKGRWANIKSLATEALQIAGIDVHRSRANYPVAPEWEAVLARLPELVRRDLRRFAGWCSCLAIPPCEVTSQVFDRYLGYCTDQMTHKDPRERWHVVRRAWNRAVEGGELPGAERIECPEAEAWCALPWAELLPSLKEDFEQFVTARSGTQLFAKAGEKPLRPASIKNYATKVRILATCLEESGVSVGGFGDLAALLKPEYVRRGLEHYVRGDKPEKAMARVSGVATAVRSIARWLYGSSRMSEDSFSKIVFLCDKVVHRPKGMCDRNRQRLAPFANDATARLLLDLPYEVMKRLDKVENPKVRLAQDAQMAALLCFLQHAPVRISNASQVDMGKHVSRLSSEAGPIWLLKWEEGEVKNRVVLDHRLGPEPSALLDRYRNTYRPLLLKGVPTSRLFVSQSGMAKGASALSRQLARFVARETGLKIHAHLMRHLMAYLYLKVHPGDYVTVQRILGHKSLQTTIDFYTGFEVESDFERFDDMILHIRKGVEHSGIDRL